MKINYEWGKINPKQKNTLHTDLLGFYGKTWLSMWWLRLTDGTQHYTTLFMMSTSDVSICSLAKLIYNVLLLIWEDYRCMLPCMKSRVSTLNATEVKKNTR